MKNLRLFITLNICMLFLTGCSGLRAKLDVASVPFNPSFIISSKGLTSAPARVQTAFVMTKIGEKYIDIWRIYQVEPGNPPVVNMIKYGKIAPGFREEIAPQKLQAGHIYMFVVRLGEISDSVVFEIREKNGKSQLQVLGREAF